MLVPARAVCVVANTGPKHDLLRMWQKVSVIYNLRIKLGRREKVRDNGGRERERERVRGRERRGGEREEEKRE